MTLNRKTHVYIKVKLNPQQKWAYREYLENRLHKWEGIICTIVWRMLPPKRLNNNVTAIITDKWVTETLALWCNCSKQWRPQRELNPGTSWETQDQIKRLNYFLLSLKSKFKIKKSISLSLWTMSVQKDQVQTKSN